MGRSVLKSKWLLRLLFAVLRKPSLWLLAIRQIFTLARNRWPLIPPFLPIPSSEFLEFRVLTFQGDTEKLPDIDAVITWLTWVADMEKSKI
ncbi:MAG: hypothetical protein QGF73_06335 [Acidimicrobiales bacterium]|nr:hypothetical protein [Acidimicrobiales bacterium]